MAKKEEKKNMKPGTVAAANEAAQKVQQAEELLKLVLAEAMKITDGTQNSVQQLMAYCRQLKKVMPAEKK